MIQTTSSHTQQAEQMDRSPQSEPAIMSAVVCSICDAAYAPSPAHRGLLQAPPTVLDAAFMSMCRFCFRCRRPACPACWDAVHGVCGACVQEAHLPFRIDAAPLDGVTFPPVAQTHKAQENTSPPLLVCVRPGRFQANVSLTTDPLKAFAGPPGPTHLEKEGQEGGRPATQTPIATPKPTAADNAPQQPGSGIHPLEVVERIVTIILLIILFAIAAMIVLAEVSGTANTQISHLFHIDIRYEMAYLISLVHQIHLW